MSYRKIREQYNRMLMAKIKIYTADPELKQLIDEVNSNEVFIFPPIIPNSKNKNREE